MDSRASVDLASAWQRFYSRIKLYGKALDSLNGPASPEDLNRAGRELGFPLPPSLRELLSITNGQSPATTGLLKTLSGWDVYRRHLLLSATGVVAAYGHLIGDESRRAILGENEIPFATDADASWGAACSIHRTTGAVSLLWVEVHDWTLPDDWQISRKPLAPNLAAFLDDQVAGYR